MKTNTTYTDIRRIIKLHSDGLTASKIAERVFIDEDKVQHVIDVKCPKATGKKKETVTEE